ncbi:MAG: hypothetical protein ACRDTH_21530 [Pseudonocardiaceae bacterium]
MIFACQESCDGGLVVVCSLGPRWFPSEVLAAAARLSRPGWDLSASV